jgi:hypothetical protein
MKKGSHIIEVQHLESFAEMAVQIMGSIMREAKLDFTLKAVAE